MSGQGYFVVYNLGVSGDTTRDLLGRFEQEVRNRIDEEEESIFVFSIGANDSVLLHEEGRQATPPEEFRQNLLKLIGLAREFSQKIVFVGLNPADEAKTTPIPWNTEKSYKNEHIERYNGIVGSVCRERGILFLDILGEFRKMDYKSLLFDGVHPNTQGHEKIFALLRDFLEGKGILNYS